MFQLLLTKATSNVDKALVYNIMIRLESSQDNYAEVISLGFQTCVTTAGANISRSYLRHLASMLAK
ncbi:hypothetical protein KCTCHS21_46380 [Cohnella abietis]|uniref:Uncharacterized protein n=2 Tax=Cohnella abietis TaxID=2507935 RepID=A0A3T1DAY9_9BACL|nr:hypothetical protein KCTCHS21_46380 [Cohnella abietis]